MGRQQGRHVGVRVNLDIRTPIDQPTHELWLYVVTVLVGNQDSLDVADRLQIDTIVVVWEEARVEESGALVSLDSQA